MSYFRKDALITVIIAVIFIFTGCNASETFNNNTGPFMPEDVTPDWLNLYANDMCVDDDLLYVTGYYSGFHIFDISEYPKIRILGHLDDVPYEPQLRVTNGIAFINSSDGLHIIDVSDPLNPILLTTFRPTDYIYDAEYVGNFLFAAGWVDGLLVIDLVEPASPKVLKKIPLDDMAVTADYSNGLLYIGKSPSGIDIFDISDPLNPSLVGKSATENTVMDIEFQGDYFYVLTRNQDMEIFSATSFEKLRSLNWLYGYASDLAISGNYAYVCGTVPGYPLEYYDYPSTRGFIYPIDISDPLTPGFMSSNYYIWSVKSLDRWKGLLFTSFDFGGVQAFRCEADGSIEPGILIGDQPVARDLKVVGDIVYTSDGSQGIRIIDVLPPQDMHHIGLIETDGNPSGFDIDNGIIVTGVYDVGVRILDPDLNSPNPIISTVELSDTVGVVKCSNGFAYAGTQEEGIAVIDINLPAEAHVVASIPDDEMVNDIEIEGNYLFYCTYYALNIIDIADPNQPAFLKSIDSVKYPKGIDIENGMAYITSLWDKLYLLDINPIEYAHVVKELEIPYYGPLYSAATDNESGIHNASNIPPMPSAVDVKVSGKYAYIAVSYFGLACVDIDPPETAHVVSTLEDYSYIYDIDVVDSYALLATSDGVRTIKLW